MNVDINRHQKQHYENQIWHKHFLLLDTMANGNGKVGEWIHTFLSNRQQLVNVNGTTASEVQVGSGVPEGSVLGPFLIVIHISDINDGHNSVITDSTESCFADDTRILLEE